MKKTERLLQKIIKTLDDGKAIAPSVIDLRGKSDVADWMVVASGHANRHVAALAEKLKQEIKKSGYFCAPAEGLPHANWVLLDAGNIIIHIFCPEVRAYYDLESMWEVANSHTFSR